MNVLHTSDWHIGKRLMDAERLPEQIAALDEIAGICESENVDVVLVAGDVFDTYLPSAEAEEVFFSALKKIAGKKRAVVLISGNHDDGVRLAASAPIAHEEGIYIFGNRPAVFPAGGNLPVFPVKSGENFILLQNTAGEQIYINALPYPNEARLREDKTDETFSEKMVRWIARGDKEYDGKAAHVLLSHLFVAGGRTSEGERNIDLGGARAVPESCLPDFGYVALGHLHRKQRVKNGGYCGSLLQYSFDEANTEKSVVLLKTVGKEISVVKEIPITSGKKLIRLETRGADEALALLSGYENCWIELTLNLSAPLTARETQSLRECNEGLISLITRVNTDEAAFMPVRSNLSSEELFAQFYKSRFGENPPAELTTAFLSLLTEEV